MAAGFNAPISGVFFAVETVLQNDSNSLRRDNADTTPGLTIAMVLLASVLAAIVSQAGLGQAPAVRVPDYQLQSLYELPLILGFGACCGAVSASFAYSNQVGLPLWKLSPACIVKTSCSSALSSCKLKHAVGQSLLALPISTRRMCCMRTHHLAHGFLKPQLWFCLVILQLDVCCGPVFASFAHSNWVVLLLNSLPILHRTQIFQLRFLQKWHPGCCCGSVSAYFAYSDQVALHERACCWVHIQTISCGPCMHCPLFKVLKHAVQQLALLTSNQAQSL